MFYLSYLKNELVRRIGKTITISLGLAIASAIIIVIISTSQSLSSTQETVLNPLENVGTDILVTRTVDLEDGGKDMAAGYDYLRENIVTTDLSQYGNAGDTFVRDVFLSGSLLSFPTEEATDLDKSLVDDYALGLILNVTHQEGEIPEIVSEIETGGEELFIGGQEIEIVGEVIDIGTEIAPMTYEEEEAMSEVKGNVRKEIQERGLDPKSPEGRIIMMDAINEAMPERFKGTEGTIITDSRMMRTEDRTITTDKQIIRTEIDTPETNIQTENFTVAGVDITKENIGLVLPDQVVEGEFISESNQVVVSTSYASSEEINIADTITLSETEYSVVGIVEPKLYTNTADIYLELAELQRISEREDNINIMLVKSADAFSVEDVSSQLDGLFTGAQVTDSSDTADKVTGSLVDAASLTDKFVGLTSIIVMIAAFIIITLLTVLSINKRTREIGTLKAIGWSNKTVVRQILMENIVLGVIGALVGIGMGLLAIVALNNFDISFSAEFASSGIETMGNKWFGMGEETTPSSTSFNLQVTYTYTTLLIGSLIAIAGAIIAGTIAAFKSSRMRPSEALRHLE
jgi:ABC-type antimicrobial peptide transport system permease subunit